MQGAKDCKKARESILKLWEAIAEYLDAEERTLWQAFLETDASFDGLVERDEFLHFLSRLVPDVPAAQLPEYLAPGLEGLDLLPFQSILGWWAMRRFEETPDSLKLRAGLESYAPNGKWKKFLQTDEAETRLTQQLLEVAAPNTFLQYSQLLYHLKARQTHMTYQQKAGEESEAAQKAEHTEMEPWDEFPLRGAYVHCAGDLTQPLPQCKLGDLCALLGYDLPWSVAKLTKKCFSDPMNYADFRNWWLIRTGKTERWFF